MPHSNRRSQAKGSVSPGFKPANFININLTKEQVAIVKATPWDIDKFDVSCEGLMHDGFKLTVRYDQRNDCYSAWLVPSDDHKFAGNILSGRGSTPMKAIKQLMYIHFNALERNWDIEQNQSQLEIDD